MKVHIPNSAFLGNINNFLSTLDLRGVDTLEITTNPKWLSVHPAVISMIASLGKSVDQKKIVCDEIMASSGHYLERMGLFNFLKITPKIKKIKVHEPAGRLIPITQIKNSTDLDDFIKNLVPLLHLDKEPNHAHAIQQIFSELIRNVLEHSRATEGAIVCAQYFKKSNKIAIGVADAGVGLKESIRQSYPVKDDLSAIKLALTPGITGTTKKPGGTAQNAGFGLFLIKSIAYINSDFFTIISGDKMYKLLQRGKQKIRLEANPFNDRYATMNISPWQGVVVGVDISLNQTEEFKSLMDIIYKFYAGEVKNQKKQLYKKPKFI
ncbi:MAG: ATP-binding protein [Candidatus Magasanikbacteria bacterium]